MLSDRYFTGRRSERIPVRVPANLTIESEGAKIRHEIFTVDVSQHGLRVASHIALSPEQVVEIFPHSAPAYSARCRVVWVGKPGSAQYGQAGLEFLNPPTGRAEAKQPHGPFLASQPSSLMSRVSDRAYFVHAPLKYIFPFTSASVKTHRNGSNSTTHLC